MVTPLSPLGKLIPDLRPGYVREFHDAVKAAIKDGKLTEREIAALEQKREELGIGEEALNAVKQELYLYAFERATENAEVTDEEWDELEQVQDYLGLTDAEVSRSKKELYRMRILSEIRKGNMPVVPNADVLLKSDEIIHWTEPVELLKPALGKKDQFHGVTLHLPLGFTYRLGLESGSKVEGWVVRDAGALIITSKQILYKGDKESFGVGLGSVMNVAPYTTGIRIDSKKDGPRLFRYTTAGNQSLVASILLSAIDLHDR